MKTADASEVGEAKRKRAVGPRTPSRGRGVLRYAALLEATEELLEEHNPDEIGLYQIAEKAGVPAPSVYHFFPTKEAAFDAFAEQFTDRLLDAHREPIEAARLTNWTDLFRIDIDRARDRYNSSPPALKIFYGGYGGVNAHSIDEIIRDKISASAYDRLNFLFHIPKFANAEHIFEMRMGILDAIWTMSVRKHGHITETFQNEAFEACVAYSRLYFPAFVERRDLLIDAAERGLKVSVTFDSSPSVLE